ncbi:MAG TPA: DUF420 domain-containing protein [Pirellulales bacterium]|nr:DUF420 domain-containing protein [Pirellulales bacterium]
MTITLEQLPTLNAALNALAAVLLLCGWVQIKLRHEQAHKRLMIAAFVVSMAFLACYLVYHQMLYVRYGVRGVPFVGPSTVKGVYLAILVSHVTLAAIVPVLAGATIWLGLADRRAKHRRLARWTFPIWLYVSITGVIIYALLYHLYPAGWQELIIKHSSPSPAAVDVESSAGGDLK